jgi:hypothetical protein
METKVEAAVEAGAKAAGEGVREAGKEGKVRCCGLDSGRMMRSVVSCLRWGSLEPRSEQRR